MFFSKWNLGLEIQPHQIIAIAVQKKRYGWQLRGWWLMTLSQPVYNQQGLCLPELLTQYLMQLRKNLPDKLSVRMTLPNHLILQQSFPLPEQLSSQQDLQWYVESSINKTFPLSLNELKIDYRPYRKNTGNIVLVTATKREQLKHWLNVLKSANLMPDVIEIEASVLQHIAHHAGVPENTLLLHKAANYDLLIAPHEHDFYFEQVPHNHELTIENKHLLIAHYSQITQQTVQHIGLSGDIQSNTIDHDFHIWSPFAAITQLTAPLPHNPSLFSVSCGLAIREDDYDTNQSVRLA